MSTPSKPTFPPPFWPWGPIAASAGTTVGVFVFHARAGTSGALLGSIVANLVAYTVVVGIGYGAMRWRWRRQTRPAPLPRAQARPKR